MFMKGSEEEKYTYLTHLVHVLKVMVEGFFVTRFQSLITLGDIQSIKG